MPLIDFDESERGQASWDYPRLKLKVRERARVNVIDKAPLAEYVHVVRAPQIVNGRPVTEIVESRDGTKIEGVRQEFLARAICLGEYTTVREQGMDTSECPLCAAAERHPDAFRPPERRFAVHVVRYALREGGFEVTEPFSATLQAWAFPQRTFDVLIDIIREHGSLREHDLLLGPCENEVFQKYDIRAARTAAWLETESRKEFVAALYKNNRNPYLDTIIGRRVSHPEAERYVQQVLERHRIAFGSSSSVPDEAEVSSALEEVASTPTAPAGVVDELIGTEPEKTGGGAVSFDDLLKELG
jgi:hypothetical protein